MVEVLLRSGRPVARVARVMGCSSSVARAAAGRDALRDPAQRARVRRVIRVTERAGRRWPFGSTCLRRCLVTGHLIRDLGPRLVIGVRRDQSGELLMHSWLEVDGYSLDNTSSQYSVLEVV